jgi:drug/metabolite transporter (DMT)-like permease
MRFDAQPMARAPLWSDRAVWLAGLFFTGDLFFWHLAILGTTVANATFLATTAPIWVALGAFALLHEAVGQRILIGLALCILGGFALLGESYGLAPQRLLGDLYGVATAVCFGCYVLAIRAARARHGAAELMFAATAITAACLFVIAFAFEPRILRAAS